mmetsp:Transcript_23381/g.66229  ORF Transcript_23381/g.66229 Transcript_23381/m.66229 type:complete len:242 (-) Transcript_23381:478-1203(-)
MTRSASWATTPSGAIPPERRTEHFVKPQKRTGRTATKQSRRGNSRRNAARAAASTNGRSHSRSGWHHPRQSTCTGLTTLCPSRSYSTWPSRTSCTRCSTGLTTTTPRPTPTPTLTTRRRLRISWNAPRDFTGCATSCWRETSTRRNTSIASWPPVTRTRAARVARTISQQDRRAASSSPWPSSTIWASRTVSSDRKACPGSCWSGWSRFSCSSWTTIAGTGSSGSSGSSSRSPPWIRLHNK